MHENASLKTRKDPPSAASSRRYHAVLQKIVETVEKITEVFNRLWEIFLKFGKTVEISLLETVEIDGINRIFMLNEQVNRFLTFLMKSWLIIWGMGLFNLEYSSCFPEFLPHASPSFLTFQVIYPLDSTVSSLIPPLSTNPG